jgi:hypothetical protein
MFQIGMVIECFAFCARDERLDYGLKKKADMAFNQALIDTGINTVDEVR